jgi:hypothetical protein
MIYLPKRKAILPPDECMRACRSRCGLGHGLGAGGSTPAWTPAGDTGLKAWYSANLTDYPAALTLNSSTVASANDLSGGGFHLVNGTAATQPIYASVGASGVMRWDGVVRFVCCAFARSVPFTQIVLLKPTDNANIMYVWDGATGMAGSLANITWNAAKTIRIYRGTYLVGDVLVSNTPIILTAVYDGVSSSLQVTDAAPVTGTSGTTGIPDGLNIGGPYGGINYAYLGDIAEILLYDGALGSTRIATAKTYLKRQAVKLGWIV